MGRSQAHAPCRRATTSAIVPGGSVPGAILFDFNGVLIEDERYHWRAVRGTVAPLGIRLSWRRYRERYLAFDDHSAMAAILRDAGETAAGAGGRPGRGWPAPIVRLVRGKRRIYRRLCAAGVRIERPVSSLVRTLARRVPLAIVSSAARSEILQALERGGIARSFRAIVAAEDVRRPKPDPEGYLQALGRLGLRAGDGCLAIEDSPGGITAARAAGLRVIAVSTSYPAGALRRAGATRVVPALGSLTAERILR